MTLSPSLYSLIYDLIPRYVIYKTAFYILNCSICFVSCKISFPTFDVQFGQIIGIIDKFDLFHSFFVQVCEKHSRKLQGIVKILQRFVYGFSHFLHATINPETARIRQTNGMGGAGLIVIKHGGQVALNLSKHVLLS
jgi:hypothetical protein